MPMTKLRRRSGSVRCPQSGRFKSMARSEDAGVLRACNPKNRARHNVFVDASSRSCESKQFASQHSHCSDDLKSRAISDSRVPRVECFMQSDSGQGPDLAGPALAMAPVHQRNNRLHQLSRTFSRKTHVQVFVVPHGNCPEDGQSKRAARFLQHATRFEPGVCRVPLRA
jgi:hypothetical protein